MCVITYLPVALHWDLEHACHCVLPLKKGHSLRLWFGFVMQMLQLRGIKKSEAEIADHHQKKMPFFVCSEVTAKLSELLCLVCNQRLIPVKPGLEDSQASKGSRLSLQPLLYIFSYSIVTKGDMLSWMARGG